MLKTTLECVCILSVHIDKRNKDDDNVDDDDGHRIDKSAPNGAKKKKMHRIYNDEFECVQTFEFSLAEAVVCVFFVSSSFLAWAFLSAEVHFKRHEKMKCGFNMEIWYKRTKWERREIKRSTNALKIIVPKIHIIREMERFSMS